MSNDLSNQLRSLNTFEWMARPATTKETCFAAADRIEKLEAALWEITWIATPDQEEARHKATEIARKALKGKDDE